MKVLVRGPALTRTGYGEHCRFVLRALREIEEIDIFLVPTNWGESSWTWESDSERAWMDEIIKKTAFYSQQKGAYDISIQITIPNEWERLAPVNIGVTAGIETTKVSALWLQKCNEMDKVITISEHSKKGLVGTVYEGINQATGQKAFLKCQTPVEVVHYPVKKHDQQELDLGLKTKFNFLTVAQWGPRKNVGATVQWFFEDFFDNPDVGLVVKTFVQGGSRIDKEAVGAELKKLLVQFPERQCKIYFLHGDLKEAEMHALYTNKQINCLVSLTHGEGFGLPLFEAAYSGLPVLATNWSGHLDFLCKPTKSKKEKQKLKPHFARVDYNLENIPPSAVWTNVLEKDSSWAYPKPGSYKMRLREVYKDYGRFNSQAKNLKKWILKNFEEKKQYKKFTDCLQEYLEDLDVENWLNNLEVHES